METAYPPVQWVVRNLIPVGSVNILAGASSSGKSRLAYDIVSAVLSQGGDWLGHTNALGRPGKVVYIDLEHSEPAIQERLAPLSLSYSALERIEFTFDLSIAGSAAKMAFSDFMLKSRPDICVIDPLLFMGGFAPSKDINNNAEISESMKYLVSLAHETGIAFLLVAHVNKAFLRGDNLKAGLVDESDAASAVLGATALFASCDTRMVLYTRGGIYRSLLIGGKRLRWSTVQLVLDRDLGRYRRPNKGESPENEEYFSWLRDSAEKAPAGFFESRKLHGSRV